MKKLLLHLILLSIIVITSCSVKATKSVEIKNKILDPTPLQIIKPKPETYKNEKLIWKGKSGNYQIHWTEKNIYTEKIGQIKKLFTGFCKNYYDINFKYERNYSEKLGKFIKTKKLNPCLISIHGQIISLVGNFLTLEIEEFYMCGIPQYYTHWVVFDLDKLEKVKFVKNTKGAYATGVGVKITDIFPDEEILEALLKNKEIKESIEAIEKEFEPKSTLDLFQWFQNKEQEYRKILKVENQPFEFEDIAFEDLDYSLLNKRALTGFNFDRIENDKIIVQLGLEPNFKQHGLRFIEIKLGIPEKLKKTFEKANLKKEGFINTRFNNSSVIDFQNGKEIK